MGIVIIENQPITFYQEGQESCDCSGQNFCQLVEQTDSTQFVLRSTNRVVDGSFTGGLDSWLIVQLPSISIVTINESSTGICDGEAEVTSDTGVEFSFNGGTYSGTNTITGLCDGCYFVTVKDIDGNESSASFCIYTNIVCLDYKGSTIQDFINDGILLGQLYNCTLGDIQP
jgi:hypothetical protein